MGSKAYVDWIHAAALTDVGAVRQINQDFVYMSMDPVGMLPNLFIVADGMGGHAAGDLASVEAVRFFVNDVKEHSENADNIIDLMRIALERTNRYIYYIADESRELKGMGTTFVACTIIGSRVYCMNVGDSRMYKITKAKTGNQPVTMRQITEDHSLVEMMRRQGLITDEEAKKHPNKNMITRAIGIDEDVQIDFFEEDITDLSGILLCSDGLTNMVSDAAILQVLTDGKTTEEKCRELITRANNNGGRDNISVVVIDLKEEQGNA